MTQHDKAQDLVERLRKYSNPDSRGGQHPQSIACREAANLITAQAERIKALEGALGSLIYEITHLSPMEDDGSHRCKVSAGAMKEARAALAQGQKEGD